MLSEEVPEAGSISSVEIFGYLSEENLPTSVDDAQNFTNLASAYVAVYRPDKRNMVYTLLYEPELITHRQNSGVLYLNLSTWLVDNGDRIGVIIPGMCDDLHEPMLCPSQVNLRIPANECLSALYYNGSSSDLVLGMDQFEEILVRLNVRVRVTIENGMSKDF